MVGAGVGVGAGCEAKETGCTDGGAWFVGRGAGCGCVVTVVGLAGKVVGCGDALVGGGAGGGCWRSRARVSRIL